MFDALYSSDRRRVPPLEEWYPVLYEGSRLVTSATAADGRQRFYEITRRNGSLVLKVEGLWAYGAVMVGPAGIMERATWGEPSDKFRFRTLADVMRAARMHWSIWGNRPVIKTEKFLTQDASARRRGDMRRRAESSS